MTQHTRPSKTGILPKVGGNAYDPNWLKIQRQSLLDAPTVTTFSNFITLAAGAPGPAQAFLWQKVPNYPLFDRYNMVGVGNQVGIRLPWDGIYDIYGVLLALNTLQVFEVQIYLDAAITSDVGFPVPSFSSINYLTGTAITTYFQNNVANPKFNMMWPFHFTGMEFHANDEISLAAQLSAAANESVQVQQLTVRWVSPIPNNTINISTNGP